MEALPAPLSSPQYDPKELKASAAETGLESLSSDDVYSAPVYCDPEGKWNILLSKNGKVEWSVMNDDGSLDPRRTIDPKQVPLLARRSGPRRLLLYMSTLNRRDSMYGYACFLVDDYGYEDIFLTPITAPWRRPWTFYGAPP